MLPTHDQLTRECYEALASFDASLANMPPLDPDVEAMITRPAATVAGSVNLLDATMAALRRPAALAITLSNISLDDAARAAVEGEPMSEVAA